MSLRTAGTPARVPARREPAGVPTIALDAGIDALGLRLDDAQRAGLRDFLALLAKWNAHYNLTAIRETAQMVTHHALDALAVVPQLPAAGAATVPTAGPPLRLLDVGTGGGIPGLPIAIARPDIDVTLLDANGKKTAFVQQAIIELALPNARVVTARVEEWRGEHVAREGFDIVISRAYAELASFARGAMRHLAPQGRLFAMKGVVPSDEIAALPDTVRVAQVVDLVVPGLDAARSLVIMERA